VALDPVMATRVTTGLADPDAQIRLSPTGDHALRLLVEEHFDLVVCNYPLPHLLLRHFLRELRSAGSASRDAGVMVLSIAELASGARRFIGRGANTVLTRWAPLSEIHQAARRLLGIARRYPAPPATRVAVTTPNGHRIAVTEVANISTSGMLVRSTQRPGIGAECVTEILFPGADDPIRVPARVVRYADPAREQAHGFALQFLEIDETAAERIARLAPDH